MNNLYRYIDICDMKQLKQVLNNGLLPKTVANFISQDGIIINGGNLSYINHGLNSSVWKYEKENNKFAFKVFFSNCCAFALNYDAYEAMLELELRNIIKALNTFKMSFNNNYTECAFDAYSMNLIDESKNFSILEISVPLLLENIHILENDIKLISKKGILMDDVKPGNTLYSNKNSMLYLSDIDLYYRTCDSNYNIFSENSYKLLNLIKVFLLDDCSKKFAPIYEDFLCDYFRDNDDAISNPISKRLEKLFSSYNKPKEFFKDNTKRLDNKFYKKYLKI